MNISLKPLRNSLVSRTLSFFYELIIRARNRQFDTHTWRIKKIPRVTVSVGGIHAGGTGKTPLCQLIGSYCIEQGRDVVILSRGYKRKSKKPCIRRPHQPPDWRCMGDEPAMIATNLPNVWLGISSKRASIASQILPHVKKNALFLLDDGFQHRMMHRDIDIVCLPPDPFSDHLIPLGYQREPLSSLSRATIICLIGLPDQTSLLTHSKNKLQQLFPQATIYILFQHFDQWVSAKTSAPMVGIPKFKKPLILTGIARSERFMHMVYSQGIIPFATAHFNDHHEFKQHEIEQIVGTDIDGILTTQKDYLRLSTINLVDYPEICYLTMKLIFQDKCEENTFFKMLSL